MGRYSDWRPGSLEGGITTINYRPMPLGDVLRVDASLLGVKLVMDFGPQSRLFHSDLLYQGSADFELHGITINLASVTFGNQA